ncbi:MAG: type II toxin-antitoxin system RelE/ParE family toxin [Candidatus Aminicenantes bacterium]|nr:type II toxin-antitoxin system RelE/ParE family toxin [Candidatus Aminicenantes bacterium]
MATKRYDVLLIDEARDDFRRLDRGRQIQVAKLLKQLESNPYKGEHLGNKAGIDLTGYYKLYADKKKIRIVYTILESEIIVKVIAIGPRREMIVYYEAFRRLKKEK